MTEETQVQENQEQKKQESQEIVEEQENDPIEQEARSAGWLPKEEYSGDPAKWVSAEVFNARTPLFEKIDELNRQLRSQSHTHAKNMQLVQKHLKDLREATYQKGIDDAKRAHRAALEDGDLVAADEIKDHIQEIRERQKEDIQLDTQVPQTQQEFPPEFRMWVSQNKWYESDDELKAAADTYGLTLHRKGIQPDKVLEKVSEHIKKVFPEKFHNPNKQKASAVESNTSISIRNKGKSIEDSMTQEEIAVMHKVMRTAKMTKEEYLKDYAAINGVKVK